MRKSLLGDVLIILASAAVILVISFQVYGSDDSTPMISVRVGENEWIYDLQHSRTVMVPGPLGDTEVVIEDGHVHVEDSPCRAKICVAAGEISRHNEWIICLPNQVFITITGSKEEEGEVDELVY